MEDSPSKIVRVPIVAHGPPQAIKVRPEKVTPNSSPKVTPDGQFRGGEWAMRSVGQVVEKIA
jgi:hypothetical protein